MGRTSASSESILALVEALTRFDAVAALYPATHARVLEDGELLRAELRAHAGDARSVSIESAGGRLRVRGAELDGRVPVARRFQSDLEALGVIALEFEVNTSIEDLHAFVRSWRAAIQGAQRTQGLRVAHFHGLPSSIRVRQREFGRRIGIRGVVTDSDPGSSTAVGDGGAEVAATGNLPRGAAAGRRWIDQTLARVAEHVEALEQTDAGALSAIAGRPLDDVLALAGEVLQHAIEHFLSQAGSGADLRKLFEAIEVATALSRDAESARVLFDVLQSSAAEVLAEEQEKRAASTLDESAAGAGEIYECSLEELRARARDCLAQAETLTGVDCEDRRECLSILAETLGDAAEPQVANAMAAQLCALLVPPPSPAESESLAAGLGALLRRLDARGIDRVLPMVVEALGDGHAALWVAPALQVAPSLDAERFESLWPHLANEALHGPRLKTSSHYPSLLAQIERLSRTCLAPAMRRLQRLDALAKGHIEKHAFRPARPALAAFYAALLGSSQGARVGVHLLAELRERPPTWLPTEFLRCFATPDAECREFLAQLLDAEDERARRAAEQRAGRALAARLLTVSHERAQEPWVVAAIEAFGARGIREAEGALRRVVDERRMSLWPAWPSEHRRAAARALERLDTTGAGST